MSTVPACPLCERGRVDEHTKDDAHAGASLSSLVWRNDDLRVVLVNDNEFPGLTRVIWREHVREMTDLPPPDRDALMAAVWCIEQAQRQVLRPDKINLAELGNMVPHLHWHVIPRWETDSRFPDAIWAPAAARSAAQVRQWEQQKAGILTWLAEYRAVLAHGLDRASGLTYPHAP
jgi:diadenosine tetraphosphate (Ap4A) HIT family hydrolase